MAEQNFIDLPKEFDEVAQNNDYILFTTFNFDPYFFDIFLLQKLQNNNPNAEIIVITDAAQYEKAYDRFTKITGTEYHLLPIYLKNGVFHPKLFLFFSEIENKATLYISSCNLTLPGFTNNAEIVSKVEYNLNQNVGTNLISAIEIFSSLINSGHIIDPQVKEIINNISKNLSNSVKTQEKESLLHNLNEAILPQVLEKIKNSEFENLVCYSPFLTCKSKLLEEIFSKVKVKTLTIELQEGNHNLEDVKGYSKTCKSFGVKLDVKNVRFGNKSVSKRRIHAKIMYFKGTSNVLLVGSPNFTEAALLSTIEKGNFETAMLYSGIEAEELVSEIKQIEDSIPKPRPKISFEGIQKPSFRIFYVNYEELGKKIVIKTEKIDKNVTINVVTKDQKNSLSLQKNLSKGFVEISINDIPTEIIFTLDKQVIRRRIYHDENLFFRRLTRNKVTMDTMIKKLHQTPNIDETSLLILLNHTLKKQQVTYSQQNSVATRQKRVLIERPSTGRSSSGTSSLFRKFLKIHRIRTNIHSRRKLEEIPDDETENIEYDKEMVREYNELYEDDENLARRIVKKLNENLNFGLENEKQSSEILDAQTLLLILYSIIIRKSIKIIEIDEMVLDLIFQNLENANPTLIEDESKKIFLNNLFDFSYSTKKPLNYVTFIFMNKFFNFLGLVKEEKYIELKKKKEIRDESLFNKIYASFLVWTLDVNNFEESLFGLVFLLVNTKNEEYKKALFEVLKGMNERKFSFNSNEFWEITKKSGLTIDAATKNKITEILNPR